MSDARLPIDARYGGSAHAGIADAASRVDAGPRGIYFFRDDFDSGPSAANWAWAFTSGAASITVANGNLMLDTTPNTACATANIYGLAQFSVQDDTLTFESRVIDAYVDQGIYGDAQRRGLAAGISADNAIEFVNAYPTPTHVSCRTVAQGVDTTTTVDIGQSVRSPAVYKIVATRTDVRFFVNGNLVAMHTANIPVVPLNVYFGTGDSCAGAVPVTVDWVDFEVTR